MDADADALKFDFFIFPGSIEGNKPWQMFFSHIPLPSGLKKEGNRRRMNGGSLELETADPSFNPPPISDLCHPIPFFNLKSIYPPSPSINIYLYGIGSLLPHVRGRRKQTNKRCFSFLLHLACLIIIINKIV
jgi:hypothetical protein